MPRTLSTTIQSILAATTRTVEITVELSFPSQATFRFATAPLDIGKGEYTNDVESVSEIRQTLENPVDQVSVRLQNKDRVLGLNLASQWAEWREAQAVIGRYYSSGASGEWIEMFRGAVQRPDANDLQVVFDVITDTVSPGPIVADRNLGLSCGFKFGDSATCGYAGEETACNHTLKSKLGCDGRGNSHHFGGMESRYNPDEDIPGTGGNVIVPPDRGIGCPRLDQYILVRGRNDSIEARTVGFLDPKDQIFNPITREFQKIKSLTLMPRSSGFELRAINGAVCYSSETHLALWYREHETGERVTNFVEGDPILTFDLDVEELRDSVVRFAGASGVEFDTLKIELETGHIYGVGNSPSMPFTVAHNSKNPVDIEDGPVF